MEKSTTHPFEKLTPDTILNAIAKLGFFPDGSIFGLNSYENRVYDLGLDEPLSDVPTICSNPNKLIAKFYRPGRWTQAQILEEHDFLLELNAHEVPVVFPLHFKEGEFEGKTLAYLEDLEMYLAIFPKVGGRNLDECSEEDLPQLGRLISRMHNIGAQKPFECRVTLSPETFGNNSLEILKDKSVLPVHTEQRYFMLAEQLVEKCKVSNISNANIRLHGDCHPGNLLKNGDQIFFLDFDDALMGHPVQDMWMMVDPSMENPRFEHFINGYQQMRDFDFSVLSKVWAFRGMRMIHYDAWLAQRTSDPAFQQESFAFYRSDRYWEDQCNHMQELLFLSEALQSPY